MNGIFYFEPYPLVRNLLANETQGIFTIAILN
jgi:hypothetical protein